MPAIGRRSLISAGVCALLWAAGCADGGPDRIRSGISHPVTEALPAEGGPVIRSEGLPQGLSAGSLSAWVTMRDALLQEHPAIVSLGQMGFDGDAHDVFALAIDVALDDESRIYVLDRFNQAVKIFGSDGAYLGSFGRAGQGPGEFGAPTALEAMSDGRLAISDLGVKMFSPSEDGYAHSATHRMELVPEKACSAADRLFVSGWDAGTKTMIHEVPVSEGRGRLQSFGRGYTAGSWIVQDGISEGPIACFADPLRVVFAFGRIPVVAAYSAEDQSLLWEATLDGFNQPPLTEMPGGGFGVSNRVVRDEVASLTPVSPRHLLLQTIRLPPSTERGDIPEAEELQPRSYLVDVATGEGALISVSLPIVAFGGPEHYVAVWYLPFTRLELRTWRE